MSDSTQEITAMKNRINNLETALHCMWALLQQDLRPPARHMEINEMMRKHFDASQRLGAAPSVDFIDAC